MSLRAGLDGARIPVQVDVGFGDAVTPGPQAVDYPVLLDAPAPKLRAYPVETVIAEKLHAMTVLGMNNSRMKDFYDLRAIGARFAPDRETLAQAIAATFERRKTDLPEDLPLTLEPQFAGDEGKQRQWAGFLRRNRLDEKANPFADCQARIVELVRPALEIARRKRK